MGLFQRPPNLSSVFRNARLATVETLRCAETQANWDAASDALAADAAALRPAVDQPFSDAHLHDVQRLPVSGGDRRRRSRILLLCVDSTPRTALRFRDVSLAMKCPQCAHNDAWRNLTELN